LPFFAFTPFGKWFKEESRSGTPTRTATSLDEIK
jgi:hypothetical protein